MKLKMYIIIIPDDVSIDCANYKSDVQRETQSENSDS